MAWEVKPTTAGVDILDTDTQQTIATIYHDNNNQSFAIARAMLIVQAPRLFNNLSDIVCHAERFFPHTLEEHLQECKSSLKAVSMGDI